MFDLHYFILKNKNYFHICSGLSRVYSLGPIVRSDFTSGKNLYEFWSLNVEEAFYGDQAENFCNLLNKVERFIKNLVNMLSPDVANVMDSSQEEFVKHNEVNKVLSYVL